MSSSGNSFASPQIRPFFAICLLIGSLVLTACSSVESLPGLSSREQVRDSIARSETAILIRASQLQALATECLSCRSALTTTVEGAAARLADSGGMWQPWTVTSQSGAESEADTATGSAQAATTTGTVLDASRSGDISTDDSITVVVEDGVATFTDSAGNAIQAEVPAELGDAPYTVSGLAAYMYSTAIEQLAALVEQDSFEETQATTLYSLLAGRIAGAYTLAQAYGFDLAEAVTALPDGATATAVGEDTKTRVGATKVTEGTSANTTASNGDAATTNTLAALPGQETVDDDQTDSTATDESDAAEASPNLTNRDLEALGEALHIYDCVAESLAASIADGNDQTDALEYRTVIRDRVTQLLQWGVDDTRSLRCELDAAGTDALFQQVIAATLTLLTSDNSKEGRYLSVTYLVQDIAVWAEVGSPDQVAPGR